MNLRRPPFHPPILPLIILLIALVPGCHSRPKPPPGYFGPTEPLATVIQKINRNNQAIPTLYARHEIDATIIDKKGRSRFINTGGDSDLFLRKPNEFYLRGRKPALGKVFETGSTGERYWFTIYPDESTRWWGYNRNIGKPCAEAMPVRPDLIAEVLGIGDINTNLLRPPIPTMTFNNDLDVYMIAWHSPLQDRWTTEKEIWYDRKTLQPRKVLLFDPNGRVLVRANLGNFQPVPVPNLPREQWPTIATTFDVFFPDNRSAMIMRLSDMVLQNEKGHPRQGTIVWRDDPDVKEIQIDADCEK